MASTRLRNALAVGAIGVALFATVGESTTETTGTNNAPNADAGSSEKSSSGSEGPSSTKEAPVPIGTAITVSKGWDMKVNSANLDADAIVSGGNQFLQPDEGKKFVLINVTLTNNSGNPESPLMDVDLSLLPPSGIAVDDMCIMGDVPDKLDLSAQMQPGVAATGNVCFEAKADEIADSLLLAEPVFTMDQNKAQKFFAIT